jgi:lysophospholipase L1-like esterase
LAVPSSTTQDLYNKIKQSHTLGNNYHILIGINDIYLGQEDNISINLDKIFNLLNGNITITSILPTRDALINPTIKEINRQIESLAIYYEYNYNDVYDEFIDEYGLLKNALTSDGIHLNSSGCNQLYSNF